MDADKNISACCDLDGRSASHMAAESGMADIMAVLLRKASRLNFTSQQHSAELLPRTQCTHSPPISPHTCEHTHTHTHTHTRTHTHARTHTCTHVAVLGCVHSRRCVRLTPCHQHHHHAHTGGKHRRVGPPWVHTSPPGSDGGSQRSVPATPWVLCSD
jgi:hypothetical protein